MAIQVRRGFRKDFDPQKMLPGEWAVSIDNQTQNQIVWMCFAAGVVKRMGTYEDFVQQVKDATIDVRNEYIAEFEEIEKEIQQLADTTQENADTVIQVSKSITETYLPQIKKYSESAQKSATTASDKADESSDYATEAESWAHGGTGTREGEDSDNAKEYAKQAKESAEKAAEIAGGDYIPNSDKGKAGGVATLGSDGKVPSKQLPEIESINIILQQLQGIYEGRDLTQVFADEISKYSDEWAWIKARIKAHNFDGINVCDYIPITMNGETVNMQVAGIDTYYRTTSNQLSHHIDFISKDCLDDDSISWNNSDNNNGTSANRSPYMASKIRTYLTTTLYNYLPREVKRVISNKRALMETRYNSSGTLEDSAGWNWVDFGLLWLPTEYEVFGSIIWGTKPWSAGQAVQYPIFANSYLNRIKGQGDGGSRCFWWLSSVCGGSSEACVYVNSNGHASDGTADNENYVPVCFRIDES